MKFPLTEQEVKRFWLMVVTGLVMCVLVMGLCILTFWVANGGSLAFDVSLNLQMGWTLLAVLVCALASVFVVGYTAYKLTP
jgi:succinate dehydrogenase hydrophobic anchor subunit